MGEFSDNELYVISEFSSEISTLLFTLYSKENDKARLVYSLCIDENAKNEYTAERIAELTAEIKNSDSKVAGYVSCIKKEDTLYDIDDLIKSFVSQEFQEDIEKLAIDNNFNEDYHSLPELYKINPKAKKIIKNFVSSAHNVITLNSYLGLQNIIESEYREKIVDFFKDKIKSAFFSHLVSDFDQEKNYYKYALTLKKSTSEIEKLLQEHVAKLKTFKKKYDKYLIKDDVVDFSYHYSFDYEQYIIENMEDEISKILKLPTSLEVILDEKRYFKELPEMKDSNLISKIEEFADYTYCHYLVDILIFLSELPYQRDEIEEVSELINLEFLKIENFTKGIYQDYLYFNFNKVFSKLFYLATLPENVKFNIDNYSSFYWRILQQINYFADKGMFEEGDVYKNQYFRSVLTDIEVIVNFRIEEFVFFDKSRFEEEKPMSIKDLDSNNPLLVPNTNPQNNAINPELFESTLTAEKQDYILNLLEDLSITMNGNSVLTPRKKSAIRGVAEALLEEHLFPPVGLERCYTIIANKINLEIKSLLDSSYTSEQFKNKTLVYIKNNPPA